MVKSAGLVSAALFAVALCSCQSAVTLKKIGEPCRDNGECGAHQCGAAKVCTKTCTGQGDCPVGFDCGALDASEGAVCYRAVYPKEPSGGFGASCGAYSPDPAGIYNSTNEGASCDRTHPCLAGFKCVPSNPGPDGGSDGGSEDGGDRLDAGQGQSDGLCRLNTCDPAGTNPCAAGFTCLGATRCDARAVCTHSCATDADCPPTYYCAADTGRDCRDDSDCAAGFACTASSSGGSGKVCVGRSWCRLRTQCTPCATADQCPLGYACALDVNHERFCGKSCTADENCPNSIIGQDSAPFMQCVDSDTGSGSVCRPVVGACHGTSPLPDTPAGGQCAWCRTGIPSDCASGFCLELQTEEHLCTQPCTVKVRKGANGQYSKLTGSDMGCLEEQLCTSLQIPKSCGDSCNANGYCSQDVNNASCYW